jgi:hypothetical protein
MELFQRFLNQVGQKYKQADKQLGGWLPGGGTPSPITKPIQTESKKITSRLRDQLIVPAIDKGIETGILPTKETMFARYLTGTSKPLTVYPAPLLNEISNAYEKIAINTTKEDVNKIFKQENPLYHQYQASQNKLSSLTEKLRNQAEINQVQPSAEDLQKIKEYEQKTNSLRESLGLTQFDAITGNIPNSTLNEQERLNIIQRHNLVQPGNVNVLYDSAYGVMPREVQLSLGRFAIKNNTIQDRYKFDELEQGRMQIPGRGSVYPDAAGGGKLGSNLIELGLKTGILNPKSGYDIRIPYKK